MSQSNIKTATTTTTTNGMAEDKPTTNANFSSSKPSLQYTLTPSPLKEGYTRVMYKIPVKQSPENIESIHALLENPIFCQGSMFQLQILLGDDYDNLGCGVGVGISGGGCVQIFLSDIQNGQCHGGVGQGSCSSSSSDAGAICIYTDFFSPKPEMTAEAILIRLQNRLTDFMNSDSNPYIDEDMKEMCVVS